MSSAHDYVVKGINLGNYGRRKIDIAKTEMPGLWAGRVEFGACSR